MHILKSVAVFSLTRSRRLNCILFSHHDLLLKMFLLTYVPTFWANSADNKLIFFFLFAQKIGFDILCKLSPEETICIKHQSLFSGKIRIVLQNVICWKFYPVCFALNGSFVKHYITRPLLKDFSLLLPNEKAAVDCVCECKNSDRTGGLESLHLHLMVSCPAKVLLGKLTTLGMTLMGWLGCKTSTQ